MSDEPLPAIEVDGKLWWPVLISEDISWNGGPGDPVFGTIQACGHDEWRRIDPKVLCALVAALPSVARSELALGLYPQTKAVVTELTAENARLREELAHARRCATCDGDRFECLGCGRALGAPPILSDRERTP